MGKPGFVGTADRDLSGKKYSGRSFSLDSILLSFDYRIILKCEIRSFRPEQM